MALQTGPYGFVYPPPTDPVRDGAVAIRALSDQMRVNGQMMAGQPPCSGGGYDPTKVMGACYNMRIATDSSGVATIGGPFSTVMLGCWIQQVNPNAGEQIAHLSYLSGGAGSSIKIVARNMATSANIGSQWFSVLIFMLGY